MEKYKAVDCKNFRGQTFSIGFKVFEACQVPHCLDIKDCDGEIIEESPTVHFEAKEEPYGASGRNTISLPTL